MDRQSHALNCGTQRIPSSNLRVLRLPPPPPAPLSIQCLYSCRFTRPAGIFSRLRGAGSDAIHNHTYGTRYIVRFSQKTMPFVRKPLFLSANGQRRTIYKRQGNNSAVNCSTLAIRQIAGIQRNMTSTKLGRGLESNASPPVSDIARRAELAGRSLAVRPARDKPEGRQRHQHHRHDHQQAAFVIPALIAQAPTSQGPSAAPMPNMPPISPLMKPKPCP